MKGTREEGRNSISSAQFPQPLKIKQVHIRSSKNPNFTNVQNYSHVEAVAKITDLLQEYQTLFPTNFSERRGIVGDLEEMKIPLRL